MTFGATLKLLRQARGLTQEQLAEKCGIPNPYLSLMETGKIVPAGDWDTKLKEALGWTPAAEGLLAEILGHNSTVVTEAYVLTDAAAARPIEPTTTPA